MKTKLKHPIWLTLAIGLSLLLLSLAYLVAFPSWILRPAVLTRINGLLASSGIHLNYTVNDGELKWAGFGNLDIRLDMPTFCLRMTDLELCLQDVRLHTRWDVFPPDIRLLAIQELRVSEGALNILASETQDQTSEATAESEAFPFPQWIASLGEVQIDRFLFDISDSKENSTQGNASISCLPKKDDKLDCKGALTLALQEAKNKTNLRLSFSLLKPRQRLAGDIEVDLTVRDKDLPLRSVKAKGFLANESNSIEYTGTISADAPVPIRLGVKRCRLAGLDGDTLQIEHCSLSPVVKTIKNVEVALDILVDASLNLTKGSGKASLQLKAASAKSLEASGKIVGSFKPCTNGMAIDLANESSLKIKLNEYQDIVKTLQNTYWAIPAPLNTLRGDLSVATKQIKRSGDTTEVPIVVLTNLQSRSQKLVSRTEGTFKLNSCVPSGGYSLDLDATLQNAKFDLPPMNLNKPAPMVPDSRIGQSKPLPEVAKVAKTEASFPWAIRVHTAEGSPIGLNSNLAKAPVRVKTDIALSSSRPPSGTIRVLPLQLELFRRTATIKNFRATLLKERSDETLLDLEGLLNVTYPDYTVDIRITGTSKSPKIFMESSPPLSQREIIALLLFGEVPSGLDFEQNESIQSMDAALAERSIGLASLYFFAKTPIQSVSYNPDTKGVTVRVRLGEKTVISATSDTSGPNKIGLRRRIGKNWAVSTELELNQNGRSNPMSSFVEWFTRY